MGCQPQELSEFSPAGGFVVPCVGLWVKSSTRDLATQLYRSLLRSRGRNGSNSSLTVSLHPEGVQNLQTVIHCGPIQDSLTVDAQLLEGGSLGFG